MSDRLRLFNDDCFNVFPQLEDKSINLFVLDLPYNQTSCHWDKEVIPLDEMWKHIKRIMIPNGIVVMFCTARFGNKLINSNPKFFRYDLIWKKSRKVGFLSANKKPLVQHENIYMFSDPNNHDLELTRNKNLRDYAMKVKKYIGKSLKQIDRDIGNQGIHHFYMFGSTQFAIPTKENYNKLIELYKLDEMPDFIPHDNFKDMWEEEPKSTYNPQKTKGKPYKTKKKSSKGDCYGGSKSYESENKGDRHPSSLIEYDGDSILIYNNPHKSIHRTQKPVELCEWLIKTYSNEGDTVMDFTMGSGTVGIACLNTVRDFVGVEKDTEIFKLAKARISEHQI